MKVKPTLSISLFSILIFSCNSGIEQNALQKESFQQVKTITPATNAAVTPNDSTVKEGNFSLPTGSSNTAKNNAVSLNPAHGQPGHRCDIAVGAPLSGAPANSTNLQSTIPAATQTGTPVINNAQPQLTVPASKSSAGLNPAHGQPGHRCDIAVGAPLNGNATSSSFPVNISAAPQATIAPATAPAPLQSNIPQSIQSSPFTISKPQTTTANQNSNVKLNPAHGQPGHDCSIAVGKPLKQ